MNNKEFIAELSERCGMTSENVQQTVMSLVNVMQKQWQEGDAISLSGFGVFEVKKKNERISVNPTTGIRMLIPPKLALNYKPSQILKDKIK